MFIVAPVKEPQIQEIAVDETVEETNAQSNSRGPDRAPAHPEEEEKVDTSAGQISSSKAKSAEVTEPKEDTAS